MKDFTLVAYRSILHELLSAEYAVYSVLDLFESEKPNVNRLVVLRHDVDRRPKNALAMAELEAELGVRSTYYFRIVPGSFDPDVIEAIFSLGHEVGYHYEDLDRAKGDPVRAEELFSKALSTLREIAPVKTIAMHGSPLAKKNNMELWTHCSFSAYGVQDCLLSYPWKGFTYFTDSGRTFGPSKANLRDQLGEVDSPEQVQSCSDLSQYIRNRSSTRMMISSHPERWTDAPVLWIRQYAWDAMANSAKRLIRVFRGS